MIGKLLGHTQVQTTARYAHLAADPVKAAADHVSSAIAKSIFGRKTRGRGQWVMRSHSRTTRIRTTLSDPP